CLIGTAPLVGSSSIFICGGTNASSTVVFLSAFDIYSSLCRRVGLRNIRVTCRPPASARTGTGAASALRAAAPEKHFLGLIDLHGELGRAPSVGVDQLPQPPMRFRNVSFRRAGTDAEDFEGFGFGHRWRVAAKFAILSPGIVAAAVAVRAGVGDLRAVAVQ